MIPCLIKKHLKTILFAALLLVIIIIIVIIVLAVKNKDKDDNEDNKDNNKRTYDYGLNLTELKERTDPDNLFTFILLNSTSEEYVNLEDGDKKAIRYLVKAGEILEKIQLRIDEINNIPFKNFLEEEIKKGEEKAILTKIVFDGQKGINAMDVLSNKINLAKGIEAKPGLGVYP